MLDGFLQAEVPFSAAEKGNNRGRRDRSGSFMFIRQPWLWGRGRRGLRFSTEGYGKALMERAEEIARESGYRKLLVISGVGAKSLLQKNRL